MAGHEVYLHGQILGTHIGTEVAPLLKDFYRNKTVDLSSLFYWCVNMALTARILKSLFIKRDKIIYRG